MKLLKKNTNKQKFNSITLEGSVLFIQQCSIVQLYAKSKMSGYFLSAKPKIKSTISFSQIFTGLV